MADMALQGAALKAAAMGAGTAVKVESVSPVDKSAMNKAFRLEPLQHFWRMGCRCPSRHC